MMSIASREAGEARPGAKYDRLIAAAKAIPAATTIIVHPCDESSLRGVADAAEAGIILPTLVGPAAKIKSAAPKHNIDLGGRDCHLQDPVDHRGRRTLQDGGPRADHGRVARWTARI